MVELRTGRDKVRRTEGERGLQCKSWGGGAEGPSLELWARYRSGEGLEGAKAHSKAERLPVKVEGTNSLSRYCAPLLSSLLPFFQSTSVARFPVGPPCAELCCAVLCVPLRCHARRGAMRTDSQN